MSMTDSSTELDRSSAQWADRPTAAGSKVFADLGTAFGQLTGQVRVLAEDIDDGRRGVRARDLDQRVTVKAKHDVASLLEELSVDRGFAWSDIAQLVGVSVGAIRKWRTGQGATAENRRSLARLAAFVDLVDESGLADDPAGWLLMRLSDRHTVTAADLYAAGHYVDLLEHLEGHVGLDALLERWDPNWREVTRSEWIVADGPDGARVLTRRED